MSGQAALDPKTGTLLHGTIEEETRQTIENIKAILVPRAPAWPT
ncbi:MAG: Rid family hydrolase [Bryobacterales bacterium]